MTTKKRRKNRLPPFIPLIKATMTTPAWRTMSLGARMLNIEMRDRLRNDYANNGKLWLSCRDAADALGTKSTRSIVRWFAENEHYGFLRKTAEGFLGADGRGIAACYRFTEFPHGTHSPTRDFEKWDGKIFAYSPRRSGRKKQNPVSLGDTPRVPRGHIRKGSEGASVCAPEGHTGSAPKCVPRGHTSRITTLQRSGRVEQGSSTARALVQAGDAGSSPAPVTKKPWLTPQVEELQSKAISGRVLKTEPEPTEPEPKGAVIDLPPWAEFRRLAGVTEPTPSGRPSPPRSAFRLGNGATARAGPADNDLGDPRNADLIPNFLPPRTHRAPFAAPLGHRRQATRPSNCKRKSSTDA
jgi:hypothetical protein